MEAGDKVDKNNGAEPSDDGQKSKRSKSKKLKHGIPTRVYSLDKHFNALAGFCSVYQERGMPVSTNDLGSIDGLSVDQISRNTNFYVDAGLLIQEKGKTYRPADGLADVIKDRKYGEVEKAKNGVKRIIKDKWFVSSARVAFSIKDSVDEGAIIKALSYTLDAEPGEDDQAIKVLVDLLVYAGLLCVTDGKYTLNLDSVPNKAENIADNQEKKDEIGVEKNGPNLDVKTIVMNDRHMAKQSNVSIQIVLNVDENTTVEKIKEIIKVVVEASTNDSY